MRRKKKTSRAPSDPRGRRGSAGFPSGRFPRAVFVCPRTKVVSQLMQSTPRAELPGGAFVTAVGRVWLQVWPREARVLRHHGPLSRQEPDGGFSKALARQQDDKPCKEAVFGLKLVSELVPWPKELVTCRKQAWSLAIWGQFSAQDERCPGGSRALHRELQQSACPGPCSGGWSEFRVGHVS